MKVFSTIDSIKAKYANDTICRKNGTLLLEPGKIPKAKHMLYQPLTDSLISEYLIADYANPVPEEYIRFLLYSNGASLFQFRFLSGKTSFASTRITIFGIPRTSPYGRPLDMEEPFDIRIEDLRRHNCIPDTWLEVGRYIYISNNAYDYTSAIFIDCLTQETVTCVLDTDIIIEKWKSFDACLCELIQRAETGKEEYHFRKKER